ncbi:hypothetical protein JB92DRAFT_863981 [Gautieria morchelliformis]|nr:hypothetical protein JB92DRAFT_863981 [Gautieria morchelliformis]
MFPMPSHGEQLRHPATDRIKLGTTSRVLPPPHSLYCGSTSFSPPTPAHTLSRQLCSPPCHFCEEKKASSSPSSSAPRILPVPPHTSHAEERRTQPMSVTLPPALSGVDGGNTGGVDATARKVDHVIIDITKPDLRNYEYYPQCYETLFGALSPAATADRENMGPNSLTGDKGTHLARYQNLPYPLRAVIKSALLGSPERRLGLDDILWVAKKRFPDTDIELKSIRQVLNSQPCFTHALEPSGLPGPLWVYVEP